jgi:hypothetical protein
MGFEPTISEFERVKAVHTLDRAATLIGIMLHKVYFFARNLF